MKTLIQRLLQGICILFCVAGCSKAQPLATVGGNVTPGRLAIEQYGCAACHTIPGIAGPPSNVGPPLGQIARRVYIAGVLANTPENMMRWLRNPTAIDPRTAMPNLGLSETEAKDIATYLYTLD